MTRHINIDNRISLYNLPDWRNTLVASRSDAERLFRQTMRAAGVNDSLVEVRNNEGLYLCGQIGGTDSKEDMIEVDILGDRSGITWQYLAVHKDYRGNNLALIAAKCVLGFAFECQRKTIHIYRARHAGIGLWPSLGATPIAGSDDIAPGIRGVLLNWASELTEPELRRLKRIEALSAVHKMAAWRRASQLPNKMFSDGETLKEKIFACACQEMDLTLNLSDRATQAILKRRLGCIPDFGKAPRTAFVRTRRGIQAAQMVATL